MRRVFLVVGLLLGASPSLAAAPSPPPAKDLGTLTLADCVVLALQNNLDIRGAYLTRAVQRYALKAAEYQFQPQSKLAVSSKETSAWGQPHRVTGGKQAGTYTASMQVPTGGQFGFSWANTLDVPDYRAGPGYDNAWSLSLTQPLLKGGGLDRDGIQAATATLQIARIGEAQNVLSLRSTLTGTIGSAIQLYRAYAQAHRSLEISQRSLGRAKQLLETNRALVASGRMAAVDIVQTSADIASKELSLLQAQNALDLARLSLIQLLNLDREATFETVEETAAKTRIPPVPEALGIALQNRPDYLTAQRGLDAARLTLAAAARNRLWDLSLGASVGRSVSLLERFPDSVSRGTRVSQSDWGVEATLTIPFWDVTIDQGYVNAKIGVDTAELSLRKLERSIGIEVTNAVRDAEIKARQVELARQARELTEQKLEIEAEKLRVGRTTNFQVVSYQNDLVSAQVGELDAVVTYLNALTTLDSALGTTLQTWRVRVGPEDDAVQFAGGPAAPPR